MAKFTAAEARAAAEAAGFSPAESAIAAAIALAESGGDAAAVSRPNSNGTVDKGAWQINSVHRDILATGNPLVLADNAKMARAVYVKQGWSAWTVYKSGAYKRFLAAAEAATGGDKSTSKDTPKSEAKPDTSITGVISSSFSAFTEQLAKAAGSATAAVFAVVLLVVGIVLVLWKTDGMQKTASVAKGAAVAVATKNPAAGVAVAAK